MRNAEKRFPQSLDIDDNRPFQADIATRDDADLIARAARRRDDLLAEAREALTRVRARVARLPAHRVERDAEVARLERRIAGLAAAGSAVAFGRLDLVDGNRIYVGRTGLADEDHETLVVDWRAPAARPFYAATTAHPLGVRRRRHLKVRDDRLLGVDDEVLTGTPDGEDASGSHEHLLDVLTAPRGRRMHDIVRTIQADQDRIIRAPLGGALVVQGAPGTGKTAVALHRAAYLLHEHRDRLSRRGVLLIGPTRVFLDHVSEVLPALGESDVVAATMADLFPGVSADAVERPDVAAVKGRLAMVDVVREAVAALQQAPEEGVRVVVGAGHELALDGGVCGDLRDRARATGLPHNAARVTFRTALLDALAAAWAAQIGTDPIDGGLLLDVHDVADLRRELAETPEVEEVVDRLWPRLTPQRLLERLWADDALLEVAARPLSPDERVLLRRPTGSAWTSADVPLLDEAAEVLGRDDSAERARAAAEREAEVRYAREVLEILHGSRALEDDETSGEVSDRADVEGLLGVAAEELADHFADRDHRTLAERAIADRSWTYGHVIVDEAQELTPMDWRALVRRCPTRSMTVVGDLAQCARPEAPESWAQALEPALAGRWGVVELDVSYRTPAEIIEVAARVLAATRPGLRAPRAIRSSGRPVETQVGVDDVVTAAAVRARSWATAPGTTAVIAPDDLVAQLRSVLAEVDAVVHTARSSKGLEFDRVVVVQPHRLGGGGDLYVALTRASTALCVLTDQQQPPWGPDVSASGPLAP